MKRLLLPLLVLLLAACSRVDTVRLRPGSVVVPPGYEPLAAVHASAASAWLLFVPIPGVSLEQVLEKKLFAAARALGADRVVDLRFHIDACASPVCLFRLIGYQEAWASGIAVRVVPALPPPVPAVAAPRDVVRIDPLHVQISRELLDAFLADPAGIAGRDARLVPSFRDGQPNGFKIFAVRPASIYSALGLENGDTIQAVNGHDLSTPDKALEAYAKLAGATTLTVQLLRRGQPVVLEITVVDGAAATHPDLEF